MSQAHWRKQRRPFWVIYETLFGVYPKSMERSQNQKSVYKKDWVTEICERNDHRVCERMEIEALYKMQRDLDDQEEHERVWQKRIWTQICQGKRICCQKGENKIRKDESSWESSWNP